MRLIPLSKDKFVLIDDEDYEWLKDYKWLILGRGRKEYAVTIIALPGNKMKTICMHRLIMNTPHGMVTDHIDGNGLNNQRANLRNVTISQNRYNSRTHHNSRSGYKGVRWMSSKKKWIAIISPNKQYIVLGLFKRKANAAKAYDRVALKYFGEYAWLNFPKH